MRRNSRFSITEVKEAEKQLQRSQDQLSASEDIARQLRMKEEDFTEALNAKDSQLAVLRVRIQESDQELHSKRQQIEEYQLERERSGNKEIVLFSPRVLIFPSEVRVAQHFPRQIFTSHLTTLYQWML